MKDTTLYPVPGYEGLYSVTKTGEVYTHSRRTVKGKWRKQTTDLHGYRHIILCKNGKSYNTGVHRVVALTFLPNPNNKPEVNHINGIKDDNRLENLEWCTREENQRHAWKNGLHANHVYGEDFPNSKLTRNDVLEIRNLYKGGVRGIDIHAYFPQVGITQIRNIYRGKSWRKA